MWSCKQWFQLKCFVSIVVWFFHHIAFLTLPSNPSTVNNNFLGNIGIQYCSSRSSAQPTCSLSSNPNCCLSSSIVNFVSPCILAQTLHLQPTSILYCLRYQRNETIVSKGNPNHNRHKRIFSWQLLGTKMLLEYIKYYINLVEMGTFSICYVYGSYTRTYVE